MRLGFWTYIILITSTSLLFLLIGLYVFKDFKSSLGFVSVYIAFTAIAMAINSHFLAEDTDNRINEIANTHFLTIISSFEDRRLDIIKQVAEHNQIKNIEKYNNEQEPKKKKKIIRLIDNHQLYLWKAVVDLDKAKKISMGKCKIDDDSYKTLMERFLGLLGLIKNIKNILLCESIIHAIDIYNKINEIIPDRLDFKESKMEDAKRLFKELLGLDCSIPVNDKLFKIIRKSIDDKNRWDKYTKYEKQILNNIEKEMRL